MKDPAQMKNQSQMMSMGQPLPIMSQSHQVMNNLNNQNSQMLMNQLINNQSHMMMNQSQPQGMLNSRGGGGGGYGMWPPAVVDQLKFKSQKTKPSGFMPSSSKAMGPRNNKNWKAKKGNDKRNNSNWKELPVSGGGGGGGGGSINNNNGGGGTYNPPTLKELQQQNRLKVRRYFSKKKFNHGGKSAPFAPRNTTSFLIRAKKAGGITSLVSPCPVTPAVLPTPNFSPSREVLVDMAKEEWGVDGYGSMKGLIRLRSPGNEADVAEDDEDEEGGSSESDVEEHLEVERRLDHDLSRFEMIYPNHGAADHSSYHLENRVDDQDTHIAQLEEENLILKERLFLMEREFDSLRKRLLSLERQRQRQGGQGLVEEVVENDSEHESYGGRSMEEHVEPMEENNEVSQYSEAMKDDGNREAEQKESNDTENGGNSAANNVGDDILKEEESMNLDDDGIIEANPDSSSKVEEEGFVSVKDDETIGSR